MSLTENNVPIQINEYFNSNYEDNLQAYLMYGNYEDDITIEDLTAGEAFYIFDNDLTNNGKIWYYPVYYNGSIFKLIAVFNYENKLYCNITEEYVEVLNEVNYNSDMLIIKEDKNTYIIDKDNNIHFIYEDESQEITVKSYEEWKKYIEDNYSFNVVLDNIVSIGNIESGVEICSGGLVEEIESDGYECCISDCFTQQFDDPICWAASVATIVKYLKTGYEDLSATDVAYTYGENIEGIWTGWIVGKMLCKKGRSASEAQMALALYDVAYSYLERKLSYYEVKEQIKKGYPIYMSSGNYYYEDDEEKRRGHATVIYGYYYYGSTQYMEMWNPGSGTVQQVIYYLDGTVGYLYNNVIFSWEYTLCSPGYVVK